MTMQRHHWLQARMKLELRNWAQTGKHQGCVVNYLEFLFKRVIYCSLVTSISSIIVAQNLQKLHFRHVTIKLHMQHLKNSNS